jgi:hypothetical protein
MVASWLRVTLAFWLVVSCAVWNGFFDILVSRGEKQYLWSQAQAELGLAPQPSMHGFMTWAIRDAATKASTWAGVVLAAGLGASIVVRRLTVKALRAPSTEPPRCGHAS